MLHGHCRVCSATVQGIQSHPVLINALQSQPVLDALEVLRPKPNSNAAAVTPLLLALASPTSRAPAVLPAAASPAVPLLLLLMPPLAVQSLSQRARQLGASRFAAASSARSLQHCRQTTAV
jgi:hypothetical protein